MHSTCQHDCTQLTQTHPALRCWEGTNGVNHQPTAACQSTPLRYCCCRCRTPCDTAASVTDVRDGELSPKLPTPAAADDDGHCAGDKPPASGWCSCTRRCNNGLPAGAARRAANEGKGGAASAGTPWTRRSSLTTAAEHTHIAPSPILLWPTHYTRTNVHYPDTHLTQHWTHMTQHQQDRQTYLGWSTAAAPSCYAAGP